MKYSIIILILLSLVCVASATAPVASFYNYPSTGFSPLTVTFNDTSTGVPISWYIEFGDGTTSTTQNNTKTYSATGKYIVNFKATNGDGSSWYNGSVISVYTPPPPTPKPRPSGGYTTDHNVSLLYFTGANSNSVTMWGKYNFSGYCGFVYGTMSGMHPLSTGVVYTAGGVGTDYNITVKNLLSNTTYYVKALSPNGTSNSEGTFSTWAADSITPINTTQYNNFINASTTGFDIGGMFNAGVGVMTDPLGSSFWGLFAIIFFVGLMLRMESPGIPLVLAIIGGFALQSVIPSDYSVLVLSLGVICIAGWIYYIIFGKGDNL